MTRTRIEIDGIPAIIWGEKSDKVWLCVHGKMSSKDAFDDLAAIAEEKGYQTLSFDLPQHGERQGEAARCDIWNGIRDLNIVGDYVFRRWEEVSLYGCSLGAYFSLHAYADYRFRACLFQSPILDMEYLIHQMMLWFGITEERLAAEKEINTPIDLMSWDYFQYVLAHPIERWDSPTQILFGGRDNLQTREIMQRFAENYGAHITIAEDSEHPFMAPQDIEIVHNWLSEHI